MKNVKILTKIIAIAVLFASSLSAFANENLDEKLAKNNSLKDSRVPSRYIPIQTYDVGESVSYTFVDRQSIKLHPYNPLIRTYIRVVNYGPAIFLTDKDGKKTPYQSMTVLEYANCDKKEMVNATIWTHSQYFSEGELLSTDILPRRWETAPKDSKENLELTIVCGLPLNK